MKELTKAEQQVMEYLWKIEKGFVKDIRDQFPNPKPAYNTVSTIIRILEKKGVVGHQSFGKSHQYYPLVSKNEYKKGRFKDIVKKHFSNSYKTFVSFFTKDDELSLTELEEMKKMVEEEIKKRKNK
ncbi:MAG: BlaI/MecI/CopY family transcriptional regulator [Bacteroidota bacterium]